MGWHLLMFSSGTEYKLKLPEESSIDQSHVWVDSATHEVQHGECQSHCERSLSQWHCMVT
jgi:hypothetical protein